jgi:glycosyltransferase involved in cell wall biosynthesis
MGGHGCVLIYHTGPLTMAIPGIAIARLSGRPSAIWTQDIWPDSVYAYGFRKGGLLSSAIDSFVRWAYRSVDVILLSSSGFRATLSRFTTTPMIDVPNWPLTRYARGAEPAIVEEENVFLFAGNVGKLQNLENVIRGYSQALRSSSSVGQLRVVGDGSHFFRLRELSERENVPVIFTGRKPSSGMNEEYERATFLVLSLADAGALRLTVPSKFPMYLSVGKPILCIAPGEVARLVDRLGVGITCDPNDPRDIARGFLSIARSDPILRDEWSRNALNALATHYDRASLIARIYGVLSSLGGRS